ncbi:putative TfdA family taurine dioxygenase [Auriculariales sp. MPI-PUGE-AT-0066]|nr:putative TfdA family taurine dioxygenase [Auriculariales sp. MPI-PUGE-AT-0066]
MSSTETTIKTYPTYTLPAVGGGRSETVKGGLQSSSSLAEFKTFDSTPSIGTEFGEGVQIRNLLNSDKRDVYLRDLAILTWRRFLPDQDLTPEELKTLITKLGELSGKPSDSTLHIHPLTAEKSAKGDQISVISSERPTDRDLHDRSRLASNGWHADITFEKVPSDYAVLKIHTLPETGGDTLWASAYEAYDRLSPEFAKFLEGLTARHDANWFYDIAAKMGNNIRTDVRGAALNSGPDLSAVHPIIRTNPVTGWKGLYVNPYFTRRIIGVTKDESDVILSYLARVIHENHDLQVRFKWSKNSVAIWDNRSTFHTATWDHGQKRIGDRAVSLGEQPYYDPQSSSRRTALGLAPFTRLE